MMSSSAVVRFGFAQVVVTTVLVLGSMAVLGRGASPAASETGMAPPSLISAPVLVPNPNPAVPLAAVLSLRAESGAIVEVAVHERLANRPSKQYKLVMPVGSDGWLRMPIVGFRPSSAVKLQVRLRNSAGTWTTLPTKLDFRAPDAPEVGLSWPKIETTELDRSRLEAGVTFVSVRRNFLGRGSLMTPRQRDFQRKFGLVIALDENGEVVWYYRSPQRIAGIQSMPGGRLMMTLADQRTRIIDMLGNVEAEYVAALRPDQEVTSAAIPITGVQTLHHEPYPTQEGTFIAMSTNARRVDNYFTSVTDPLAPRASQLVMGDSIIEYDARGKVVWSWNSFDHLDPMRVHFHLFQPYWVTRGGPGHLDWTHGNGVTYDEQNRTIIVSLKQLDALVGISRETGAVKWIYADPAGWTGALAGKVLRPKGKFVRFPASPHHPHADGSGTITYYDNGTFQALPFSGKEPVPQHLNFSRAVRVRIDEQAMTFEESWTSESRQAADSCYNWAMGEAETLPVTRNVLVIRANCTPPDPAVSDFNEYDLTKRFVDEIYGDAYVDQYTGDSPAVRVARYRFSHPDQVISWTLYGGLHRATVDGREGITKNSN